MNTIIFNDTNRLPVSSYNRSINVDTDGVMHSSASVSFVGSDVSESLVRIAANPITSIEIERDGTSIYRISNLYARLTDINESFYDGSLNVSAQIHFNESDESSMAE